MSAKQFILLGIFLTVAGTLVWIYGDRMAGVLG